LNQKRELHTYSGRRRREEEVVMVFEKWSGWEWLLLTVGYGDEY